MTAFFSWYFLLTLLGWITFPLVYKLFPALADRGYTLSRTTGLLLWGYIFWIFTSLGISQNDVGGITLALVVLLGLSIWAYWTIDRGQKAEATVYGPWPMVQWLKEHFRLILTTEILFLLAFGFLAFIRAANPEIVGTEKPMELAFIDAILRSPQFPPHDPWLSGYAISYYHFGYILTAMLAMITAVPGTMSFNLMLALVFGLAAIGAYGILYNLLALAISDRRQTTDDNVVHRQSSVAPLLGPLFLLIVSNIEGFLELIYRYGIFWSSGESPMSRFWTWINIKDLTTPPPQPYEWTLQSVRYLWWWRASRVVQDYDLAGNWQEIIDEFPFFSFLLGDLHPHVLAIPFDLLAISVALHLFLGASKGTLNLFGVKLHISPLDFGFTALVLGGLAFLNTWDILVGAALIVFAYMLFRVREDGWRWDLLEDLVLFAIPLAIASVLLYLPFYLGFSSQAGGVLPNLINPTRGAHLWVMFAPLFIPIFAYLFWPADKPKPNWRLAVVIVLGLTLLLWGTSWLGAFFVRFRDPAFTEQYLRSQGVSTLGAFFSAASIRRLATIGSLLTLLAILIFGVAYLLTTDRRPLTDEDTSSTVHRPPSTVFVLLLILLGGLLVLGPEFLYLRDQFGWRINTIFKFYYQAWILWSIAAAFGVAVLLQNLRGIASILFRVVIGLTLIMALTYPVLSLATKTNDFNPPSGYTLDDFDRVRRENPDEAAALDWLKSAPEGVIAEAIGGSYSAYARISTYSGMPTVLGWPGHESQWRGGGAEQGTRNDDIIALYTTPDWNTADDIIHLYNIRYIYIGSLERSTMRVQEEKFKTHLKVAYQNNSVVIYEVP